MNILIRKIVLASAVISIVSVTTFIFHETQGFNNNVVQGERLFSSGKYHRALPFYEAAYFQKPDDVNVIKTLDKIYSELGSEKELKNLLTKVWDRREDVSWNTKEWEDIAFVYYQYRQYDRTEFAFKKSLSAAENEEVRLKLAEVLIWQKKYEEAVPILKAALETKDLPQYRKLLADAMKWSGHYDEAVSQYTALNDPQPKLASVVNSPEPSISKDVLMGEASASELIGDINESLFEKARSLNNEGKFEEANGILEGLHVRDAANKNVTLELARSFESTGKYQEAVKILMKSFPDDKSISFRIAGILESHQDFYGAREQYLKLLTEEDRGEWQLRVAELSSWLKDYPLAIEYYQKLINRNPQDISNRQKLAEILWSDGRIEETQEMYLELLKIMPGDLEIQRKYIDLLLAGKKNGEAIKNISELLETHPDDLDLNLQLARVLSWERRFEKSLEIYGKIIEQRPGLVEARRERARILGWQGKFEQSIREYKSILKSNPDDEAARLEMLAKSSFYAWHNDRAGDFYQQWLKLESENIEALSDLGEVFSRQRRWEDAKNTYVRVLEILPDDPDVFAKLYKNEKKMHSVKVQTGYRFDEADSASRSNDRRSHGVYTNVIVPVKDNLSLKAGHEFISYAFSDFSLVSRDITSIGLDYFYQDKLEADFNYEYSNYSDGLKDSHNFKNELQWKVSDYFKSGFAINREDIIENSTTLRQSLHKDDYAVFLKFLPVRKLSSGARYSWADYSDGNAKGAVIFDTSYKLLEGEQQLSLFHRYENYGFDDVDPDYFSPGSFHTNEVGLEYTLSPRKTSYDGGYSFYIFRYSVNFDVHDQRGHNFLVDLNHDITQDWAVHARWQKKVYEHKDIYGEDQFQVYLKHDFGFKEIKK